MQNREEKRLAVKRLLADPKWQHKSDRSIARHLQVSQPFVSSIRKVLAGEDAKSKVEGDNVITDTPSILTGETLVSAGCSIALARRIVGRLNVMPAAERRRVERAVVEVLL